MIASIILLLESVYEYVGQEENPNPLSQENSPLKSTDQVLCLQPAFRKPATIRYSHQAASKQIEQDQCRGNPEKNPRIFRQKKAAAYAQQNTESVAHRKGKIRNRKTKGCSLPQKIIAQ
jgi:hypothetical protein